MDSASDNPKTLQQAIQYFSDEQICIDAVAMMRWPDGPRCPDCWTPGGDKGRNPYYLKTQKRWKCRDCRRQFSVKVDYLRGFPDLAAEVAPRAVDAG